MFLCDFLCPGWMIGFQMAWPSDGGKNTQACTKRSASVTWCQDFAAAVGVIGVKNIVYRCWALHIHRNVAGRISFENACRNSFRNSIRHLPQFDSGNASAHGRKIHFKRPKTITISMYRNCRLSLESLWSYLVAPSLTKEERWKPGVFFMVVHRVFAALVSGQSRGVSRWKCVMPVWAHDACSQSLVHRSSHAARARGDNKTQGQVFDSCFSRRNLSCLDLQSQSDGFI